MTIAHPIGRAWLSTGGPEGLSTGSQNYDEFADDAEITAIIAANPISALGVEMPHRAPDSLGRRSTASLPAAAERLAAAKDAGRYAPYDDVAVVYRITAPDGTSGLRAVVHGRHRPDLDRRPTSRVMSSATRTCSSRRCASGSRWPNTSATCCRRCCCWRPTRRQALHDGARRDRRGVRHPGGERRRPGRSPARTVAGAHRPTAATSCSRWPAPASWWSPTATTAASPRRWRSCRASSRSSPRRRRSRSSRTTGSSRPRPRWPS